MDTLRARYQDNLSSLRSEIATHCAKAGRSPSSIQVVAVTKYVGPEALVPLLDVGVLHFGENRVQQAVPKLALPVARAGVWHFIGHLQKNKVREVVQHFDWIHSIDSAELGARVAQAAGALNRTINCLVQVNIAGEATKSGVSRAEAYALVRALLETEQLNVRGLMTIAPLTTNAAVIQSVFRDLRSLFEEISDRIGNDQFTELSMGMSNDFGLAIEEGATMVRIGRRLLGV